MPNGHTPIHDGFLPIGEKLLVVIDHHGATIYRDCSPGTVPEVVVPDDSEGHRRHLRTRREPTDGKRKPEQKSYYEAIAVKLIGAHQILIFGSGTGASSAMEHLCDELADHHATIATCVVGTVVVDSHHTSPNQLLAKASEYFSKLENPQPNLVKPKRLVTNLNSTS